MEQDHTPWTEEMRRAFRDPEDLARHLGLRLADLPPLPGEASFPFLVPRTFVETMRHGDPRDPVLRQVWPDKAEEESRPGEFADPVGDAQACRSSGLLQKYEGRVLVVATGACALACRYCFRQNYPYVESPRSDADWDRAFEALESSTPGIAEVLLSGGDPLSLPDTVLSRWFDRIARMPSVETIRIHTRFPVAIPARVTRDFLEIVGGTRLRTVVVLHANHPAELGDGLGEAAARLRSAGATLLNQSVLLAGVNDDTSVLIALSRKLWSHGILPYYLHALDPVHGSSRFRVPDERGLQLVDEIRTRLPGYLVPRFVREVEGEASKIPLR